MNLGRSDLEAAAHGLGIAGGSRMRKRELITAIELVEPRFFEAWLNLVQGSEKASLEEKKGG